MTTALAVAPPIDVSFVEEPVVHTPQSRDLWFGVYGGTIAFDDGDVLLVLHGAERIMSLNNARIAFNESTTFLRIDRHIEGRLLHMERSVWGRYRATRWYRIGIRFFGKHRPENVWDAEIYRLDRGVSIARRARKALHNVTTVESAIGDVRMTPCRVLPERSP